ncbi:hypothetical protein H744_2c2489 [Photobacterium gaetbulicola Gung47]|uniref:SH3b domain-containing protein n=2 Tax=Photobacterium gaetbulicola TaxID=1295392 RepID=A0A0C5X1D5_9GAMM|nr:hypothetical protein H744_2c2489 [Photobacterium gaetbulicola Gung47]
MYRLYTSTNRPSSEDINWLKKAADSELIDAQYDYALWAISKEKYKEGQDYLLLASSNGSYKAKSYLKKNEKLIPLWVKAEKGNTYAILQIGEHYWQQKKYEDSLFWYERCAEELTYCSFYLGLANDQGYGVKQNHTKAAEWYRLSATKGNRDSQRNLAWLYESGLGTQIDKSQAFYWMSKAADTGLNIPTAELGRYYLYGIGTEKDTQKAFKLLSKAATENKFAAYHLANMYFNGWGIEQDYNKSFQWFMHSSKQDHTASLWFIGEHYYKGLGRDKNNYEAFKWYSKAAENGDKDAQFRLGWMLSHGEGAPLNNRKAFEWYLKSAEQGVSMAQNNLGYMYENGLGTDKNINRAFSWYKQAAENGNATAQNNLGISYQYGTGVSRNYPLSVYWYAKSAQQNNKSAQNSLNNILYKLKTRKITALSTDIYSESGFNSTPIKSLKRGEKVYVLSEGSQWTEVYHQDKNSLGFIHNTHLL